MIVGGGWGVSAGSEKGEGDSVAPSSIRHKEGRWGEGHVKCTHAISLHKLGPGTPNLPLCLLFSEGVVRA